MVADDEPALRGALAELLAQEDRIFFVGAAADADEAIALAQREQPDVALLDVKMPAGGGPRAEPVDAGRPVPVRGPGRSLARWGVCRRPAVHRRVAAAGRGLTRLPAPAQHFTPARTNPGPASEFPRRGRPISPAFAGRELRFTGRLNPRHPMALRALESVRHGHALDPVRTAETILRKD